MNTQLRDYQVDAMDKALKFYKKNKIFMLNMCVGGGKTLTAIHLAMKLVKPKSKIVVVCHTDNLKYQFQARTATELGLKVEALYPKWEFYTFHSLRNKKKSDLPNIGLLIIDEIHQGGQSNDGSYQTILENLKPTKILGLSATDSGVSEFLFGEKTKDNSFTFSFSDAKKAGVLNDCDILTIHTGLQQRLQSTIDLTKKVIEGKNLKELASLDKELGVNLSDERTTAAINEANLYAAVEVYFKKEADPKSHYFPQAVFFVGTIEHAEFCKSIFLKRYSRYASKAPARSKKANGEHLVRVTHSKLEKNNNIEDFRNKKFPVLINVRQIQEGFDDPDLELVFDCAPSFTNEGRIFIQRIGRELRTSSGKSISRYYVFHKATGRFRKYDGENIERVLRDNVVGYSGFSEEEQAAIKAQTEIMIEASIAENSCDTDADLDDTIQNGDLSIDFGSFTQPISIDDENAYQESQLVSSLMSDIPNRILVTRSNYIVSKAKKHVVHSSVKLHELLEKNESLLKGVSDQDFIAIAKKAKGI